MLEGRKVLICNNEHFGNRASIVYNPKENRDPVHASNGFILTVQDPD
jgi:hypothetical protein